MGTDIVSVRLGEKIAGQLRDEIVAGRVLPGSAVRLAPLAERLGVSTTPVREALAILERQGLLHSKLHRGFRVAEITPRDIADIYSVHAYISQLLTEQATRRISDVDIEELEALDTEMRKATKDGDADRAADLNHDIHRRIHLLADSPLLVRFLRETTPFVSRRRDVEVPGWAQQRLDGHGEIIQAMRRRDGALAASLMAAHIRRSGDLASKFAADKLNGGTPGAAERRGAKSARPAAAPKIAVAATTERPRSRSVRA